MAREFAKIKAAIWQDDDFRTLPPSAQHLYFVVLTDPELSYCGVADWRPKRMLPKSAGWDLGDLRNAGAILTEHRLLVVDEETEEVLVRSFLRHDGVMQHNKLCVSAAMAHAAVASNTLRGVVVHELLRLRDEFPDWPSWERQQVQEVLKRNAVDPAVVPPLAPGVAPGVGANASKRLGVPYNSNSNSNIATATEGPANAGSQPEKAKRATRLPASWSPTDEHQLRAREDGVDITREVMKFRTHAEDKGRTSKSWNAAFTQWLIKAAEYAQRDGGRPRKVASDDWMQR